jgi:hypothetical protein
MNFNKTLLQLPTLVLKVFGLWWDESAKWPYFVFGVIMNVVFLEVFTIFHAIFLIKTIEKGCMEDTAEVFNSVFTLIVINLKTIWFVTKVKKISEMKLKLIELLKFDGFETNCRRIFVETHASRDKRVLQIFYTTAMFGLNFPLIQFFLNNDEKLLPVESYYYFDYKNNDGLFWSLALYQYIVGIYSTLVNFSIDLILLIFISMTSAVVNELSAEIQSATVDGDSLKPDESLKKKLENCIELDIKIKAFAAEISENLSFCLFLQAFLSSIILCGSILAMTTVNITLTPIKASLQSFLHSFLHSPNL